MAKSTTNNEWSGKSAWWKFGVRDADDQFRWSTWILGAGAVEE